MNLNFLHPTEKISDISDISEKDISKVLRNTMRYARRISALAAHSAAGPWLYESVTGTEGLDPPYVVITPARANAANKSNPASAGETREPGTPAQANPDKESGSEVFRIEGRLTHNTARLITEAPKMAEAMGAMEQALKVLIAERGRRPRLSSVQPPAQPPERPEDETDGVSS